MKQTEKTFQVLDTLDRNEISTQRQLADHSGISLGQVNYILKSLLERGLVKVGNFRKNPNKIGYVYLLTPKGIEAKSKLAVKFVVMKLREYDKLRSRLTERLIAIEEEGLNRVIFVGPSMVKDFINSIIKEKHLEIIVSDHYENLKSLKDINPQTFNVLLLFDEDMARINRIIKELDISRNKLLFLW
ncbi:MAG: MarR family EPS-associated transcriptional regulator, partial [Deltaproteobacteria bacterium]|nr:MarR family EPS-associated transcriptional regulator [Deltaproteobacteria bacterium]